MNWLIRLKLTIEHDNNERNILWDIYGVMFESYVAIKMKQMIVSYC